VNYRGTIGFDTLPYKSWDYLWDAPIFRQTLVRFEDILVGCTEISLPTSTSDRRYASATGLPLLEHGPLPALPPSHRVGCGLSQEPHLKMINKAL